MKHAPLTAKRPALIGSLFAAVVSVLACGTVAVRALDAAYWVPSARYSDVAQPVDVVKTEVLAKAGVGRL